MNPKWKIELGEKFRHSPLIQILLFSLWARVLLGVFLLIILSGAIVMPRIWMVSPSHFDPKIRVSLFDLMKASAVSRKAEQQQQMGKYEDSLFSWGAAWNHNSCNANYSRGWLKTVLHVEPIEKQAPTAYFLSSWLLRLANTNKADVELCVQVLNACRWHAELIYLLRSREKELTGPMAAAYLKALFYQGQAPKYKEILARYASVLPADKELQLVQLAYEVDYGSDQESSSARNKLELEAVAPDKEAKKQANQLLLRLAFKSSDLTACERSLSRLIDARLDSLGDHLVYWNLLLVMGQRQKALDLAQNSAFSPHDATDTLSLANLYIRASQTNQAIHTLSWHLDHLGLNEQVGQFYAELLIQAKDWQALGALALRIRDTPNISPTFVGWTYFLEGRAELGTGRREYAEAAFNKVADITSDSPALGAGMGRQIIQLGFVEQGLRMLTKLEQHFNSSPDFWVLMSMAAAEVKDGNAMERAASKAYELAPDDVVVINNYAATLLSQRKNPAEAIKLTLQLMKKMPEFAPFQINHAEGLIANGRFLEAEKILRLLDQKKLSSSELQQYSYNRFQICLKHGQLDEARQFAGNIDPKTLFPVQEKWFKEAQARLQQ